MIEQKNDENLDSQQFKNETNKLGDVISMDDDDNITVEDFVEEKEFDETEEKELTDKEKKEILVYNIQNKGNNFHPIKHPKKTVGVHTETSAMGVKRQVKDKSIQTNVIDNPYGNTYAKSRKRKNKIRKNSRKANR